MKILITGAGGFVGRNLYEYLSSKKEYEVTAATSSELDLLDEKAIYQQLKETKYDIIIHASIYNPRAHNGRLAEKELEYDLRMFYNFSKYHDLYG
ncbi:MAG: sugar nucleotide-binding protein, partial [Lachnospiraceae bacterium]|nr:sugar nucleotide-binding protein [Lachnospiraceae bacterium]